MYEHHNRKHVSVNSKQPNVTEEMKKSTRVLSRTEEMRIWVAGKQAS